MAWRIVKQPNGLLALWSDPVDNFTVVDMTPEEAYRECRSKGLGEAEAREKVQRGISDEVIPHFVERTADDGLDRWRDCIATIELVHGKAELDKVLAMLAPA